MSMAPSNQLARPSLNTLEAINTLSTKVAVSKMRKSSDIGTSTIHPTTTEKGTTNNVICVEEPTATDNAKSIFPLAAALTAVTCSAALPTMGSNMSPIKDEGKPYCSETPSMESTRNSEQ